jgi:hypothetical protein
MRHQLLIKVEIPALDRLVTYLEDQQQKEIDALTAQVQKFTSGLGKTSSELQSSVDQNTKE